MTSRAHVHLLVAASLSLAACGGGSSSGSSGTDTPGTGSGSGSTAACGDGTCSGGETCGTCPSDCGGCSTTCEHPVFTSDDPQEDHVFSNGYKVYNNAWGEHRGPQTIYACSPSNWYVVSNQPVLDDSRGEIKSYPCTGWDFGGRRLDTFESIVSTFAEKAPASGVWNATYDIWLGEGDWGDTELMVWNDYRYLATLPPGDAQQSDTATIDGQTYHAWTRSGRDGTYIALAMKSMHPSGKLEFRHIFDWLVSKGWLKKDIPVHWFEYGIEIGETGTPMTFAVTDFSVTAR